MFPALAATLIALVGCESAQRAVDASQPPADFAIGLTVDAESRGGAAWYVVDADGVLRVAPGARAENSPVPPIVRQLALAQRRDLWSKVSGSGLQAAVWEAPQVNEASMRSGATLFIASDGVRRAAALEPGDARISALIDSLRTLAWLPPAESSSAR